jgi:hypothetical protein
MKKTFWKRTIKLFLMQLFISYGLAFANSPNTDLKIPSQIGTIKEVFTAQNPGLNSGHTIIQIQDAHCNYEAQKNLAKILEYLIKERNLKLIMVEGGWGDVSLSFMRNYADRNTRQEVAEKYLKKGEISGEEYLDIVSDYDFQLFGIEDESLYDSNLEAFLSMESYRQEALNDLEKLSVIVERLKPNIYNPQLLQVEAKLKDYADKKIDLSEYVSYLRELAERRNFLVRSFPNFYAFSESSRLEKMLDFKQAESERNNCIKALAKFLDENSFKELLSKSQDFKAQKISPYEYYSFLKGLADRRIDLRREYPQLETYILYITWSSQIDANELLKEMALVEEKTKGLFFATDSEKKLNEISQDMGMLKDFLNLDLTPEEYQKFRKTKQNFFTASWVDFLSENCQRYGLREAPFVSNAIDNNLDKLEEFYTIGIKREESFIKNIADKMSESKDNLAVVITGGFHTPGITRLLKERGYSYAVVTPTITQKADPEIYFSVLRAEKGRDDTTTDSD